MSPQVPGFAIVRKEHREPRVQRLGIGPDLGHDAIGLHYMSGARAAR